MDKKFSIRKLAVGGVFVYIGIKVKDEVKIFRRELKGDRNKIRQRAMMHALYNLLKILK